MNLKLKFTLLQLFVLSCIACANAPKSDKNTFTAEATSEELIDTAVFTGAEIMEEYLPLLKDKRVGLIVNQTSIVGENHIHLLDTLLNSGVQVKKVFAPEHGFRGDADAGETVKDGKDIKTGIPIISLYGNNKKPTPAQMSDIDLLIFDIQDVGARFYTYISTMHYAMEACAENEKEIIILDRPNPFDHIDGPIMERKYRSFVGLHPIPLVHGCTVGELALMINGEGWLESTPNKCRLTVIQMKNWEHGQPYSLPIKPSPNLPNDQSIALYPSLCLFEATTVSVGRGTTYPFQVAGAPDPKYGDFTFTPVSLPGFDKNPMHKNKVCYGVDLREIPVPQSFTLSYFLDFYHKSGEGAAFFSRARWFDQLTGTDKLRKQIIEGKTEEEIKAGWKEDLEKYKEMRQKYVLYEE